MTENPEERPRRRVPVGLLIGILVILVVFVCCGAPTLVHWYTRATEHATRYPGPQEATIGNGSLTKDILPWYGLSLPCQSDGVHYFDDEGNGLTSGGTLWLSLRSTTGCLTTWERTVTAGAGLRQVPGSQVTLSTRFGWSFPAGVTFGWYSAAHLSLAVQDGTTVYLVAQRVG